MTSSSGSDEGPAPSPPVPTESQGSSQEADEAQELVAQEKTIDAYVNFKRYAGVNGKEEKVEEEKETKGS